MDLNTELYPFESHFIEHEGGHQQHYIDEGPASSPKDAQQEESRCFLMVHGNPTWSFYFRNLVIGLRDRYRCVVPDHMGCGKSNKAQTYTYSLAQHIKNLEALVLKLDLKNITLVLHDWGGAIGMGLAKAQPERIKGIVVLNTAAFLSPLIPFRIRICRWPILGTFIIRALNGFAGPALSMAVAKDNQLPKDVAKALISPYDSWANRVAVNAFVKDIPLGPEHPSWQSLADIEASLSQFHHLPTLICWGAQDFCFNLHFLERWKEEFPQAKVNLYQDAGHYVLEDAGDRVLEAINDYMANQSGENQ
ncbi:MAG: alpha/beta fold hydrolase [Planctomycetes bacterium]|nr:alpha/beta fold hydrolase [Planctomycetota bacterium]